MWPELVTYLFIWAVKMECNNGQNWMTIYRRVNEYPKILSQKRHLVSTILHDGDKEDCVNTFCCKAED